MTIKIFCNKRIIFIGLFSKCYQLCTYNIVHIRLNKTVLTCLFIYYTLLLNHVLQRQCVNETNAPIYLNMHQFCAFKLRSNCALTGEQQVYRSFNVWMKLLGCTLQGRRCVCVLLMSKLRLGDMCYQRCPVRVFLSGCNYY